MSEVQFGVSAGVATVTMSRPSSLNAMNGQLADDLVEAFGRADQSPEVKVVILRGEGASFSAGADLKDPSTHNPSDVIRYLEPDAVDAMMQVRKPVIAAIQGYCVGVGVELAAAADIAIAADDAVFFLPQVSLGIVPGSGGIARLVRRVGETWATRLVVLGERIDARQALEIGLVSEVVGLDDLAGRAEELAATLAGQPMAAVQLAKQAILEAPEVPLSSAIRADKLRLHALSGTEEKLAAHAAFSDRKQRP